MSKDILLIYRVSIISDFEIIATRNNDYLSNDSAGFSMKPILELSKKATTILLSILMLTSTAAIVGTVFHPANAASLALQHSPTMSSQATRSDMALASESPVQTAMAHARTLKASQQ